MAVEERASPCPIPPQPISAICTLSLADVFAGLLWLACRETLSPAPAAAVVKNSRREVTLYFLSDDVDGVVVGVELELELSEDELPLLLESFEELAASFFSDFSEEPLSEELSPSFLPPLPWLVLPLFA